MKRILSLLFISFLAFFTFVCMFHRYETFDFHFSFPKLVAEETPPLRIAVVGDSISTYAGISPAWNGEGYYPRDDITDKSQVYSYIAASEIGAEIVCLQAVSQATIRYQSVNGYSWYGWADDWVTAVKSSNPDIIIIHLGINDCFERITGSLHVFNSLEKLDAVKQADTYGAYQYMLTKYQVACPEAKLICVIPSYSISEASMAFTPDNFDRLCDLIAVCADFHSCKLVDFRKTAIDQTNISKYTYDGIHPNFLGMQELGRYLGEQLSLPLP